MRKRILCLFFILKLTNTFAQINIKTYSESIKDGYMCYADNNEACEVTFKVTFKLKNLRSSAGIEKTFVLPPNSKKNELSTLLSIKKRKYNFSYTTLSYYGNYLDKEYDSDYNYSLPFKNGDSIKVSQGYNGTISHQNKNQLDFKMPIGTEILSARNGTVIKVVDGNDKHCAKEECKKYNNYIIIAHNDGTFAEYAHIKRKGAKVKPGEKVEKGQLIALSGNVGWSTGPHLHFSVYFQRLQKRDFLKTKFKTGDGSKSEFLSENQYYTKNYD